MNLCEQYSHARTTILNNKKKEFVAPAHLVDLGGSPCNRVGTFDLFYSYKKERYLLEVIMPPRTGV